MQMILNSMGLKLEKDEFDSAAQVKNPFMHMILQSIPFKLEKVEFNSAAQRRTLLYR
jgi:hypothetical protein